MPDLQLVDIEDFEPQRLTDIQKARILELQNDPASKVKTKEDYVFVAQIIQQYCTERGIENVILLMGNIDQNNGASAIIGQKPNLLEMIKYINTTVLKIVAPHFKVKIYPGRF